MDLEGGQWRRNGEATARQWRGNGEANRESGGSRPLIVKKYCSMCNAFHDTEDLKTFLGSLGGLVVGHGES